MGLFFFLGLRTSIEKKTFFTSLTNTVSGLLRVNIAKESGPYLTTS
jgi:hypothetical protein